MGRGSCENRNPANLPAHGMMQWSLEPEAGVQDSALLITTEKIWDRIHALFKP